MVCKCAKNEVTGFRCHQRDLHRRAIAHFADQNDFRRLAQRGAQAVRDNRQNRAEFALVERRLPFGCTNSIGSSSVTTWTGWVSLISLSNAASVVVLPLPVAPVTRTRPVFSFAIS